MPTVRVPSLILLAPLLAGCATVQPTGALPKPPTFVLHFANHDAMIAETVRIDSERVVWKTPPRRILGTATMHRPLGELRSIERCPRPEVKPLSNGTMLLGLAVALGTGLAVYSLTDGFENEFAIPPAIVFLYVFSKGTEALETPPCSTVWTMGHPLPEALPDPSATPDAGR